MIPQTISHYRIINKLGAGGMGEVYLAEDTRLGRKIALKVLTSHFKDEDRLRRFEYEARAVSALNHPNIITIHEIGETADLHFIATEYIEGETLRQHMAKTRMNLSELLDVAIQVANALVAAHRVGIVHRDIKPENIMLRPDGYVKVLDFGIAKLTEPQSLTADAEALTVSLLATDPGLIIGTPNYMSPEQARGLAVDTRTDVWSLGVVIYEMVTGRAPFQGATISDVLVAVLERELPLLALYSPEAPAELEQVVNKALAKDREERYRTANDLARGLNNLKQRMDLTVELEPVNRSSKSSSSSLPSRRRQSRKAIESLAILPLSNAGGDPNMEYLSDGITESIINSLSQLPKLRVVPRSSVFRYKGREVDPGEVARELGVRAVMTGRVLQLGDRLLIGAELVDVPNDSQIWGEHYNRELSDIFEVQEEIAREISEKLRIKLTGEQKKRLIKRHTHNTEAYQHYLKGLYHWNKRTPAGLKAAIRYFNQAIDIDPGYALAYAGVASCYSLLPGYTGVTTKEAHPKARAAAIKALDIDETLAEAYLPLANVQLYYEWNWSGAEKEYKRATKLNPNYAAALHSYCVYLVLMGRSEESLAHYKRAQELDPLSLSISSSLAWALYVAGQYDEAIEQCNKTLEMDTNFARAHIYLGEIYIQKGMYEQAIASFQVAMGLSDEALILMNLGYAYAVSGKLDEAQKVLSDLKGGVKHNNVSPYYIAMIYIGLGEKDQFFALLDKAYEERSYWMPYIKTEPRFKRLHSDPRFIGLVRRVGLTQ